MKKMIVGFGIVVAFVTPSFAQSYIASYGTGKLIDTPLLEKTNGLRIQRDGPAADRWDEFRHSLESGQFGLRLLPAEFAPAQKTQQAAIAADRNRPV